MLLDARTRPEDSREPGLRRWEDDRFLIAWKGHLYVPGETAGAASAARLAAKLRTEGLETVAHRLSGVFGLFVHDKERAAGNHGRQCRLLQGLRTAAAWGPVSSSWCATAGSRRAAPIPPPWSSSWRTAPSWAPAPSPAAWRSCCTTRILYLPPGGGPPRLGQGAAQGRAGREADRAGELRRPRPLARGPQLQRGRRARGLRQPADRLPAGREQGADGAGDLGHARHARHRDRARDGAPARPPVPPLRPRPDRPRRPAGRHLPRRRRPD